MLLFLGIFLSLFAYLGFRIGYSAFPIKVGLWRAGLAVFVFICVIALQFTLFRPNLPRFLLLAAVWLDNTLLLMIPLLLLTEIPRITARIFRKKFPARTILLFVAVLAGILGGVGEFSAFARPQIRSTEISVSGLAPEFDGYRILFLSDLHFCKLTNPRLTEYITEAATALQPDIILLGGDYADGDTESQKNSPEQLSSLHAADGIFAIPGNHEYFHGYRRILDTLALCGVQLLENNHVIIRRGEKASIAIAGLTDDTVLRYPPEKRPGPGPDLRAALADIPSGTPIILLDHQPKHARQNAATGRVALQLSGHTHGGMIAGISRWIVAPMNGGYASGLYEIGSMILYVGNGTSLWNGFSCRLGVPAEITELILRCK